MFITFDDLSWCFRFTFAKISMCAATLSLVDHVCFAWKWSATLQAHTKLRCSHKTTQRKHKYSMFMKQHSIRNLNACVFTIAVAEAFGFEFIIRIYHIFSLDNCIWPSIQDVIYIISLMCLVRARTNKRNTMCNRQNRVLYTMSTTVVAGHIFKYHFNSFGKEDKRNKKHKFTQTQTEQQCCYNGYSRIEFTKWTTGHPKKKHTPTRRKRAQKIVQVPIPMPHDKYPQMCVYIGPCTHTFAHMCFVAKRK